ncbi:hypothetical protein AAF712_015642 [Marasmius tenuissimus]|uniref:Myb/SANT-like domain-containing protein n=1 Tax=Marasmius tenuissimus TaxID=585030 RepID=A0ABR2ZA99_9AGAR
MADKEPAVKWTRVEDEAMIDALTDKLSTSKQPDGGWKSTTWTYVETKLSEVPGEGKKLAKKCANRFKDIKDSYADNKQLQNMSGFGWDDERQMVTAGDNQWKALKKTKAKGKANLSLYKNTPFPLYDKMAFLCDGHMADGSHAFHPGDDIDTTQDFVDGNTSGVEPEPEEEGSQPVRSDKEGSRSDKENTPPSMPPTRKRKSGAPDSKKAHKCSRTKSSLTSNPDTAVGFTCMADAVATISQSFANESLQRHTHAVHQLEKDRGLDDEDKNDILFYFADNSCYTMTYLALPDKDCCLSYLNSLLARLRD